MQDKSINVQKKEWGVVYNTFDQKFKDNTIISLLDKIASSLKREKKDYIYIASIPIGTKIINNGKITLSDFNINSNELSISKNTMYHDLSYTGDPFGFVYKGQIEIVTSNTLIQKNSEKEYYTFLNRIEKNDFFGLFGTLDILDDGEPDNTDSKWIAIAGENTFEVCYPWENDNGSLFNNLNNIFHFKTYNKDKKHEFFHKLNNKNENVEVIYLPKHFLFNINNNIKSNLISELYKIGWKQASYLRDLQLELKYINDIIHKISHKTHDLKCYFLISQYNFKGFMHKPDLLANLVHYIINVIKGKAKALVLDNDISYIEFLKEQNKPYFKNGTHFIPLLFRYEIIKENQWGCLLINRLPILLNYEIKNYIKLCEEINLILQEIQLELKYKITGFGHKNTSMSSVFKKQNEFKLEYLVPATSIDSKNISVTSEPFANIIVIERLDQTNDIS